MTDKEKIKRIKKVIDNNGNDYWDDCGIMCDQIQSIVNEQTSEWWKGEEKHDSIKNEKRDMRR